MSNKRWALIGALTLIAALALAACGTGAATTAAPEAGETDEPAPEVTERTTEDTIIICMSQEPDTLYPVVSSMAVASQVFHLIGSRGWIPDRAFFFETQMLVNNELPTIDNGGAVIENDQLTVTFSFKPEITWSDGTPFTVDDLIFTRDVILDPESGATTTGTLESEVWTKVDDSTLTVTYAAGARPATYYLPTATGPFNDLSFILPSHALEGMAPADITTSDWARDPDPVLGPYQVEEWVEGDHISLTAVEGWWGGEVATPNVIYRFISDTNQLLAAIMAGDCDYGTSDGIQLTQLPVIQEAGANGWIQYDAIPSTVWEHIDMNVWPVEPDTESGGVGFFVDARVRQAVAYGTNRQQMTEQILYGEVQPLSSYLPADHWAWNPETEGLYPYDPDQAAALLADAGWADGDGDGVLEAASDLTVAYSCDRGEQTIPAGTRFEVSFHTTTGNAMRQQIMAIFQSNMADIGISVVLDPLPAATWFGDDGPLNTRKYQIGEFAWVSTADPANGSLHTGENIYQTPDSDFLVASTVLEQNPGLLDGSSVTEFDFRHRRPAAEDLPEGYVLFYPEQIQSSEDNWEGQNNMGWCNPAASQASFDGGNELTNEARLPYYLEFQRLFAEDMPSLPLFQRVEVEAYVNGLCGPDRGPGNLASWNVETWVLYSDGGACE
jgi:peptide/nickel transport system substrate-binding protein